jgi:hypothetical protein
MKKITAVLFAGLLGSSLVIHTAGVARADDDDRRDNRSEREDLRRDSQQLEELRRHRDAEAREGDRGEVREYNQKIRKLENDMRKDRRELRRDRDHDRDEHHDHD